jgi:hypothetical protein
VLPGTQFSQVFMLQSLFEPQQWSAHVPLEHSTSSDRQVESASQ